MQRCWSLSAARLAAFLLLSDAHQINNFEQEKTMFSNPFICWFLFWQMLVDEWHIPIVIYLTNDEFTQFEWNIFVEKMRGHESYAKNVYTYSNSSSVTAQIKNFFNLFSLMKTNEQQEISRVDRISQHFFSGFPFVFSPFPLRRFSVVRFRIVVCVCKVFVKIKVHATPHQKIIHIID